MTYSKVLAPVNENNLPLWEEELANWNDAIDLLERATSIANDLASGRNLVDDLDTARTTANRLAGQVALKVERLRRSQNEGGVADGYTRSIQFVEEILKEEYDG